MWWLMFSFCFFWRITKFFFCFYSQNSSFSVSLFITDMCAFLYFVFIRIIFARTFLSFTRLLLFFLSSTTQHVSESLLPFHRAPTIDRSNPIGINTVNNYIDCTDLFPNTISKRKKGLTQARFFLSNIKEVKVSCEVCVECRSPNFLKLYFCFFCRMYSEKKRS